MYAQYLEDKPAPLVRAWLGACAGGGVLATFGIAGLQFSGYLLLFGVLLGAAQSVVIGVFLRTGLTGAGLWTAASIGGWVLGSLSVSLLPLKHALTEPSVSGAVVLTLPWVGLGLGQLVALAIISRHDLRAPRALMMGLWAAANTVGGLLTYFCIVLAYSSPGGLGKLVEIFGAGVVQQALLIGLLCGLYGLPTSGVLVWIARTLDVRGPRPRLETPA